MRKRIFVIALVVGGVLVGTALGTMASGVSADTGRGGIVTPLKLKEQFANGGSVKLKVTGPMDFAVQRIVAVPGATFGWHRHPAENINVVKEGTLTLYHDENCTVGINYGPGAVFTTSPDQIHLARNNGTTDLVLFATYFIPLGEPIRIDQPNPNPAVCPQ